VFTDKASGKDTQRPQLEALLSFVREGDTVVVHSMDRLARNLDDLRRLVQKLTQRGVRIEFLKEGLVFTGEDSPMAVRGQRDGWPSRGGGHEPGAAAKREGIAVAYLRDVLVRIHRKAPADELAASLRPRATAGELQGAGSGDIAVRGKPRPEGPLGRRNMPRRSPTCGHPGAAQHGRRHDDAGCRCTPVGGVPAMLSGHAWPPSGGRRAGACCATPVMRFNEGLPEHLADQMVQQFCD
jgi:hypothetical protein